MLLHVKLGPTSRDRQTSYPGLPPGPSIALTNHDATENEWLGDGWFVLQLNTQHGRTQLRDCLENASCARTISPAA